MKKVVIIGAGLGGLAAGAILAKRGYPVHVFEEESIVGGRALTLDGNSLSLQTYKQILQHFDIWLPFSEPSLDEIFQDDLLKGYRLDLGFHLLGFISKSPAIKLLRELGNPVSYTESRFGLLSESNELFPVFQSFLAARDVVKVLPHLMRLLFATDSFLSKYENIPISQVIERYCTGTVKYASEIAARLVSTVNNIDQISAYEILGVGKKWGITIKPTGYPYYGTGAIANAFAEIIERAGGRIITGSGVDRIDIKNGIVKSVIVNGNEFDCDICISNIPVQALDKIINDNIFPAEYEASLRQLTGTGSVCVFYGLKQLDKNLIGKPITFLERNLDVEGGAAAGIIDFQTAHPLVALSPPGKYLVQGYIICTPQEARDKKTVRMLKDVLDSKMEILCPGYRNHLEFALYPTSYHLDGVAKTYDQDKPVYTTPVKGLYLVGDCIRSTGIGMNCAVDSATRLVNGIISQE